MSLVSSSLWIILRGAPGGSRDKILVGESGVVSKVGWLKSEVLSISIRGGELCSGKIVAPRASGWFCVTETPITAGYGQTAIKGKVSMVTRTDLGFRSLLVTSSFSSSEMIIAFPVCAPAVMILVGRLIAVLQKDRKRLSLLRERSGTEW